MKLLVRWGLTLGLASSVMFAGILGMNNLQALALPQEQVVKILQEVPVFTLTNPKGEPLVGSNESKTIFQIAFFISKDDAQKFLDNTIKKKNPELASTFKISSVSLAYYYQIVLKAKQKRDSVIYSLVPTQQQIEAATNILSANGKKVEQFNGIPLFIPKLLKKGYLTIPIPQEKERFVPVFFEKEQAAVLLEEFKKAFPKEAGNAEIEVTELDSVINTLTNSKDATMSKFLLYPSRESIEFLNSLPNQPKK
jgi:nickel transport protein